MVSRITQAELIIQSMDWDLPYTLKELEEKTEIDYFSLSKALDRLVNNELVYRLEPGTYIKYSPKNFIKSNIKKISRQLKHIEKNLKKLNNQYIEKVKEFESLKERLQSLENE